MDLTGPKIVRLDKPEHVPASAEFCQGCENWYDPEVCYCGEYFEKHDIGSGHSPVAYGCSCYYLTDFPLLGLDKP